MATDFRVVTPTDIGETIKLDLKETGKYDVDISALQLPEIVTDITVDGTNLTVHTIHGDKTVDLQSILPTIVADRFLKGIERSGTSFIFTVDNADGTATEQHSVPMADFLPIVVGDSTLSGDGTSTSPLVLNIHNTSGNLLKSTTDGVSVMKDDITDIINETRPIQERDIRLVNANGTQTIGYLYSQG